MSACQRVSWTSVLSLDPLIPGDFSHHSVAQSWPKRRQDAWLYHAVLLSGDLKKTEQIKVFFSLRR
jgi:hypothetical protein